MYVELKHCNISTIPLLINVPIKQILMTNNSRNGNIHITDKFQTAFHPRTTSVTSTSRESSKRPYNSSTMSYGYDDGRNTVGIHQYGQNTSFNEFSGPSNNSVILSPTTGVKKNKKYG